MYTRPLADLLEQRLRGPRRFLQVLAGPRQVGKTTLVRQVLDRLDGPSHYASADEPTLRGGTWVDEQWEVARALADRDRRRFAYLVLDEVQKVSQWSEAVKRCWDGDSAAGRRLKVALLGSSPLLMQRGLTESLAGRFEIIRANHWTWTEIREAFGFELDRYLYFGGYPGAAPLAGAPERWTRYILDSLIEPSVSRDILLMTRVEKPALLRRLFHLACQYSGQILSYQKMLGQLQDAGNTTTLAHYLDLLAGAGMVTGLQKFAGERVRRRASSPKLQVMNTALMSALSGLSPVEARADTAFWGRLVESAVGAHLVNTAGPEVGVYYWRDRQREVDFVLQRGKRLVAIEVKSGRHRQTRPGLDLFRSTFGAARVLLVGQGGIPVGEFLEQEAGRWID